MNKARRATLNAIMNAITEQKYALESVRDDEETAKDNLPESLQGSDRYDTMEEAVNAMDDAICSIEEAINRLEDVF